MDKVNLMMEAKVLQASGHTQAEIARRLGKTERTIRNYLHPKSRPRRERQSKLEPYKPYINSKLEDRPEYNCELLYAELAKIGYSGKISILRDYVRERRRELISQAVLRFETIPGLQAQVDWKEFGRQHIDGVMQKLYAFVMVLGYSRKPFIRYTTCMDQATFDACHVEAFLYFGGVPREALYDNAKTAFYMSLDGEWKINPRLLALGAHYGFVPKRCQVRRPETKGKVERLIGFLDGNFWPRFDGQELTLAELNADVNGWVEGILDRKLTELGESRRERFAVEAPHLQPLPEMPFDVRRPVPVAVNREAAIRYKTNRYSVPVRYIGKTLSLLVHPFHRDAELVAGDGWRRPVALAEIGSRSRVFHPQDISDLKQRWERDRARTARRRTPRKRPEVKSTEVETRPPCSYDDLFRLALMAACVVPS